MKAEDSLYVPVPDTIFSPVLVKWTLRQSTQHCLKALPGSSWTEWAKQRDVWDMWAQVNYNFELVELLAQNEVPLDDARVYETIDFSSRRRLLRLMVHLLEKA